LEKQASKTVKPKTFMLIAGEASGIVSTGIFNLK
jgi:hypothetical protein